MQMEVLSPGVKHGKEADVGAEQSRVGGGFEQSGSGSTEQDLVNLFRVLKRQPADLSGQRENDVEIRDSQKLGFALRQPAGHEPWPGT